MVNRMRHTRGHTRNRRSHHALTSPRLSRDSQTGSFHLRHRVDMTTGMYRGRKVLEVTRGNLPASGGDSVESGTKQARTTKAGATKVKKEAK